MYTIVFYYGYMGMYRESDGFSYLRVLIPSKSGKIASARFPGASKQDRKGSSGITAYKKNKDSRSLQIESPF